MKKTQKELVLNHLKQGERITSMQAFHWFGCTRLASIIFNLRQEGYDILTDNIQVNTRYGKTNIARYEMGKAS